MSGLLAYYLNPLNSSKLLSALFLGDTKVDWLDNDSELAYPLKLLANCRFSLYSVSL